MTARFKTAYGKHHNPTVKFGPGLTHQSFKDDCDINNIVSRFENTGILEHKNTREPQYVDIDSTTLHEAMNIVADANSAFADLPSQIRAEFHNDPAQYLDFCQNPENLPRLVDLGLANPPLPDTNINQSETAPPVSNQQPNQASEQPAAAADKPASK